jgi:hypothetical protein
MPLQAQCKIVDGSRGHTEVTELLPVCRQTATNPSCFGLLSGLLNVGWRYKSSYPPGRD